MLTNSKVIATLRRLSVAQEIASEKVGLADWQADDLRKLSRRHLALAVQMESRPHLYPPDAPANKG